jgi:hypothetical protein
MGLTMKKNNTNDSSLQLYTVRGPSSSKSRFVIFYCQKSFHLDQIPDLGAKWNLDPDTKSGCVCPVLSSRPNDSSRRKMKN